jgi:hypothetical protein
VFDSHILAWKRHLKRQEMKALLAAVAEVRQEWRVKWDRIDERNRTLKERAWRT